MNATVLPRTVTLRAAAALRTTTGALIRGPIHALVRDRVVQIFVLGLVALGMLDAVQFSASVRFVAGALIGIAPFLLLAVAIAAFASASGADRLIARAFSGSPGRTIAVWALVRRSVFVLYLALGLGGAMLSGVVYQVSGLPV